MSKREKTHWRRRDPLDSRTGELLTIAWMLSVVTTLVCEVVSFLSYEYVIRFDPQAGMLKVFASLLLFAAFVIGVISLLILPIVLKARRDPPPRPILVFAIIVGLAPLVIAFWQQ